MDGRRSQNSIGGTDPSYATHTATLTVPIFIKIWRYTHHSNPHCRCVLEPSIDMNHVWYFHL